MELLDIYDSEHRKTGRTVVRDGQVGPDDRLLIVHVCIFNSSHEMLIQQRQPWKDRYPGCWDVSAGGFAASGEDADAAVLRELEEELGISAAPDGLSFVLTEPFSYVLDDFFVLKRTVDIRSLHLQEQEVAAVRWAGRDEIMQMIDSGEFVDYSKGFLNRIFDVEPGL